VPRGVYRWFKSGNILCIEHYKYIEQRPIPSRSRPKPPIKTLDRLKYEAITGGVIITLAVIVGMIVMLRMCHCAPAWHDDLPTASQHHPDRAYRVLLKSHLIALTGWL
jgi:hypothetical protein